MNHRPTVLWDEALQDWGEGSSCLPGRGDEEQCGEWLESKWPDVSGKENMLIWDRVRIIRMTPVLSFVLWGELEESMRMRTRRFNDQWRWKISPEICDPVCFSSKTEHKTVAKQVYLRGAPLTEYLVWFAVSYFLLVVLEEVPAECIQSHMLNPWEIGCCDEDLVAYAPITKLDRFDAVGSCASLPI